MATTVTDVPLNTYAAGSYTIPVTSVPLGVTFAQQEFDITRLTELLAVIGYQIEISQDGGTSWTLLVGGTLDLPNAGFSIVSPGVIQDIDGRVRTVTRISAPVPNPANSNRKVRGSLSLSRAIQTAGTLILS